MKRTIRFFPDHARSPLWDSDSEKILLYPNDLGLSESLGRDILQWTDFWNHHYDVDAGWDNEENERKSKAEGDDLVARIQRELGESVEVIDRRWY
ncbi:hypothetical protein GCM10009690_32170 [Brevibacterium permense]|uniref:Uncharacterized protein n=1 Tax=Brevibacterium permense TaxID=234834 RepID=A0ABN2AVV4_9MICO